VTERRKAMKPYDVTSSFAQVVDVEPREAREVLTRIHPMRTLADRLSALGLDDRAMWTADGEELTYSLVWRFGNEGGSARFDWHFSVDRNAAGRTVLTVKLGGRGSDPDSRARVLSSWLLLEELAENHARRLARTLDDYANADDYEHEPEFDWPQLRAAV
jgi:hypothetical protein